MASQRRRDPELAAFFTKFKKFKTRGWKADAEYAQRGDPPRFPSLDRNMLNRLGAGGVKFPGPDVLRDFAACYEVPYEDLVSKVVERVYAVSLVRRDVDINRLTTLESELARVRTELSDCKRTLRNVEAALGPPGGQRPASNE